LSHDVLNNLHQLFEKNFSAERSFSTKTFRRKKVVFTTVANRTVAKGAAIASLHLISINKQENGAQERKKSDFKIREKTLDLKFRYLVVIVTMFT
jgi:hypothetical protein